MGMSSLSHSVDASYISIDNSNLVNHISMGRTLPTWRERIESRIEHWSIFRRALRLDERSDFDRLVKSVRMRSSACSMIPAVDEIEPALLAMLVGLERGQWVVAEAEVVDTAHWVGAVEVATVSKRGIHDNESRCI